MRPAFKRTHHTATSWGERIQGDTGWEQTKITSSSASASDLPSDWRCSLHLHLVWTCSTSLTSTLPASNGTCHGCGKRRHWQQLCKASSANAVSDVEQNFPSESQPTYFITHDVFQVSSSPKGIFVDLALSPPSAKPSSPKHLRFQVDSRCSCNTTHVTDLNNLLPVQVNPSPVRLLD